MISTYTEDPERLVSPGVLSRLDQVFSDFCRYCNSMLTLKSASCCRSTVTSGNTPC